LKLTTDKHEASRGLSVTAELFVKIGLQPAAWFPLQHYLIDMLKGQILGANFKQCITDRAINE